MTLPLHLPAGGWSSVAVTNGGHLAAPIVVPLGWRPAWEVIGASELAERLTIADDQRRARRRFGRQVISAEELPAVGIHHHHGREQQQLDYDLRDELGHLLQQAAGAQQQQHLRPHQQFKNKKPVNVSISQRTVNGLLSLLLLFVVSVSGSIGAILVISSLTVIESLQQRGNCYLVSLALSHLLVTLLVIPTSALQIMAGEQGLDGRRLCHYQWLALEFTLIVSHLSFLLIAADNYLGYKCSQKVSTTAQLAAAASFASQQHYDSAFVPATTSPWTSAALRSLVLPPPEVVVSTASGLIDASQTKGQSKTGGPLPNGLYGLDHQHPNRKQQTKEATKCFSYHQCCTRFKVLTWILLVWLLAFAHTFNQHDRKYGPKFCAAPASPLPHPHGNLQQPSTSTLPSKQISQNNNNPTWPPGGQQQLRNQIGDHAHELATSLKSTRGVVSKFKMADKRRRRAAISGAIDSNKLEERNSQLNPEKQVKAGEAASHSQWPRLELSRAHNWRAEIRPRAAPILSDANNLNSGLADAVYDEVKGAASSSASTSIGDQRLGNDCCDDEANGVTQLQLQRLNGPRRRRRRRRYENGGDASGYHRNNASQVRGDINLTTTSFVAAGAVGDGFEGQFNKAPSSSPPPAHNHSTLNWGPRRPTLAPLQGGNDSKRPRRYGQRPTGEAQETYYYWDARDLDGRLMNNNNAPRMQIGAGQSRSQKRVTESIAASNEAAAVAARRPPSLAAMLEDDEAKPEAKANKHEERINRLTAELLVAKTDLEQSPVSLALSMGQPSVNQSLDGAQDGTATSLQVSLAYSTTGHWLALIATTIVPSLASGLLFARAYLRMKEFKMRPQRQLSALALQTAAATGLLTPSGHASSASQLRTRLSSSSSSSSSSSPSLDDEEDANTSCNDQEQPPAKAQSTKYRLTDEPRQHLRQQHSAPDVAPPAAPPTAILTPRDQEVVTLNRRPVDVAVSAPTGHHHHYTSRHLHRPPVKSHRPGLQPCLMTTPILQQQQQWGVPGNPHRQISYSAPPPPPSGYEFRRSQHHAQSFHCVGGGGAQRHHQVQVLLEAVPVVSGQLEPNGHQVPVVARPEQSRYLTPSQQPLERHRSLPRSSRLYKHLSAPSNQPMVTASPAAAATAHQTNAQEQVTEALASVIKSMDEDQAGANKLKSKKSRKKKRKKKRTRSELEEQQQRLEQARMELANNKAILCTYLNMTDDQLLKSNIIVFLINLILCLPLVALSIAAQDKHQPSQELKDTVWWLATLNCCTCSYVYAITNKDFREAFNKLFYYCCCKSHVTFQRKAPIFRRQLDEDAKGNLRVHIIPGANLYASRGLNFPTPSPSDNLHHHHSSSLSPLVKSNSPLPAAAYSHSHSGEHHRYQPPVRHHHMSPGGGFGGPAFANPQTRQLHRAADRQPLERL